MDDNTRKIKLLRLFDILKTESDEEHPLTTEQLCKRLEDEGIFCDRRTLSKDIEVLNRYDYEVLSCSVGRKKGYYIADRCFSIAEIRLLTDAVMGSHLITEKKTEQLIEKLSQLCSSNQSELIKSSIVHFNSGKCTNEKIYYTIDALDKAIKLKRKVNFVYFHLNENRKKIYHSLNGIHYVQPAALIYNNDNYYLTCYDQKSEKGYNYRLDRIEQVVIEDEQISKEAERYSNTVNGYSSRVFGMYGGETFSVTLEFTMSMIDQIYDKFGNNIHIIKAAEDRYTVNVDIQISPVFFSWVFQYMGKITVIGPEIVVNEYKKMLECAINQL